MCKRHWWANKTTVIHEDKIYERRESLTNNFVLKLLLPFHPFDIWQFEDDIRVDEKMNSAVSILMKVVEEAKTVLQSPPRKRTPNTSGSKFTFCKGYIWNVPVFTMSLITDCLQVFQLYNSCWPKAKESTLEEINIIQSLKLSLHLSIPNV